MNTDRLGKLMEAYRLADENAGNDGGGERAKHEGEIRVLIGGGEAAADPWPDTVRKASEAPDLDAAWRLLADALRLPVVRCSGEWRDEPDPDPVIWRDHAQYHDAVLSSGEVAILSGAGKSGKSYIALALAVAAAQAEAEGRGYGESCGLRVAARPVVVLSYEDAPKRIDQRAVAMDTGASVRLIPDPPAAVSLRLHHPAMGPVGRMAPRMGGGPRRGPRPGGDRHRPEGDGRRDKRRRRSDRVPSSPRGRSAARRLRRPVDGARYQSTPESSEGGRSPGRGRDSRVGTMA